MAGIGFELRRMLKKESLSGKLQGYTFAAIIGSGPWVLSIIAILAIGMLNTRGGATAAFVSDFQVSITYLMASSLVATSVLQLMFTRFVADRLFEHRDALALPNLLGALLLTVMVTGLFGLAVAWLWLEGSVLYRLCMLAGFVILCAMWVVLVFASTIKAYRRILLVFLVGYSITVIAAYGLRHMGVEGLLLGFVTGQATLLFLLLAMVARQYPGQQLLAFGFLQPALIYPSLIFTGLFYNVGVWADKVLFWFHADTGVRITGPLQASPVYDLPIFLSYLSLIPGLAIFLIRMETDFSERCEQFYTTIKNGGTLVQIEQAKKDMVASVRAGMLAVLKVQGATTIILLVMGGEILAWFGVTTVNRAILNIQLVGVAFQLLMLSALNVFYYLDQRRAALLLCLFFLVANTVLTWGSLQFGAAFYGYGFGLAMLLTSGLGIAMLVHKLDFLEYETFMLQPANT